MGTSLAIPGVKRIVKEMARVLHSGRHGKGTKVVYLSDSPPAKMAEWDGVFDVWIKGDIQRFVIDHLSKAMISTPKKSNRKREVLPTPSSTPKRRKAIKKEEECSSDLITPTKAAGKSYLPTPRETPPSRSFVENSLTALSSLSGEEEENPFLNLAKGNVSPEDA